MNNKIVVIGSSHIDLIMKMEHLPEKGETVQTGFLCRFMAEKAPTRQWQQHGLVEKLLL